MPRRSSVPLVSVALAAAAAAAVTACVPRRPDLVIHMNQCASSLDAVAGPTASCWKPDPGDASRRIGDAECLLKEQAQKLVGRITDPDIKALFTAPAIDARCVGGQQRIGIWRGAISTVDSQEALARVAPPAGSAAFAFDVSAQLMADAVAAKVAAVDRGLASAELGAPTLRLDAPTRDRTVVTVPATYRASGVPDVRLTATFTDTVSVDPATSALTCEAERSASHEIGGVDVLSWLFIPLGFSAILPWKIDDSAPAVESIGCVLAGLVPREVVLPGRSKLRLVYEASSLRIDPAGFSAGGSFTLAPKQPGVVIRGAGDRTLHLSQLSGLVGRVGFAAITTDLYDPQLSWSGTGPVTPPEGSPVKLEVAFPEREAGVTVGAGISVTAVDGSDASLRASATTEFEVRLTNERIPPPGPSCVCGGRPPACRPCPRE